MTRECRDEVTFDGSNTSNKVPIEESQEKKPNEPRRSALKQGQKKLRKQKEAGQGAGEVQPELLEQAVGV